MARRPTSTPTPSPAESTATAIAEIPKPTKKPVAKATPTPLDDDLDEIVQQQGRLARAAEQIFARLADGAEPTPDERALLRQVGPQPTGSDRRDRAAFNKWLDRNVGRLRSIRELQDQAGSVADREAAKQAADTASKRYADEAPKTEKKIQELQDRLAELANQERKTQATFERRESAMKRLTEERLLPSFVQDVLRSLRDEHNKRFGIELTKSETRLSVIEAVLGFNPDRDFETIRLHIESNVSLGGDTISRLDRFVERRRYTEDDQDRFAQRNRNPLPASFFNGKIKLAEWQHYCNELRQEAEQLRQRIVELKGIETEAAKDVEQLKSYYIPN